jgi:hypothetical protein
MNIEHTHFASCHVGVLFVVKREATAEGGQTLQQVLYLKHGFL